MENLDGMSVHSRRCTVEKHSLKLTASPLTYCLTPAGYILFIFSNVDPPSKSPCWVFCIP